ncbi:MAG TPA: pyridoxamine 5'-phosphate oxidase family protein [Mycobacteriales bacterium]|nr:pyridoxamine 5'-phosphate oxidase family protein [Mycobacteriales bacterium]
MLRLAPALTRSALGNARAACAALGLAREDRASVAGGLRVLDEDECLALLARRTVGRLAYVARAGVPDVTPVNYLLDGRDVLVRSAPGPKLQAAERGDVVAFEVDDLDEDAQAGWSVVLVGRARRLSAAEAARTPAPVPWSDGVRRHVVRISPTRITGRALA